MFVNSILLAIAVNGAVDILKQAQGNSAQLNGLPQIKVTPQSPYCGQFKVGEAAGQQQSNGGNICVSTVQGAIPDVNLMITNLIVAPENQAKLKASNGFDIKFQTKNLMAGNFVDLKKEFLLAPQTLDPKTGMVQGFMQVSVQQLPGIDQVPKPTSVSFFMAMGDASDANGVTNYSVTVPPNQIKVPGEYRICTMSAAASGQPVIMPVAQRGAQDDCVRVTIA